MNGAQRSISATIKGGRIDAWATCHEIETGEQVRLRWHYQKSRDLRAFVRSILKGKRGTISPAERAIVEGIENRLNQALGRTPTI